MYPYYKQVLYSIEIDIYKDKTMNRKKPILLTQGDPAGVGPEICIEYLFSQMKKYSGTPIAVLGSARVLEKAAHFSVPDFSPDLFKQIPCLTPAEFADGKGADNPIQIVDFNNVDIAGHQAGKICAEYGIAAFEYIRTAIDWTMNQKGAAVVTAPIHKVALHLAGIPFPGHTEMLAHFTRSDKICMVLSCPELTTALVTAHVGYSDVVNLITPQRVWETLEINRRAWRKILNREPRFTVCGLNPHAGENGLFGNSEEERVLIPVIENARAAGYLISGPIPPDTAFIPAKRKQTDVYICMYHDQGLIPLKMLGFDSGVNITLGLPIVRTSVDHGTAMDIAFGSKPGVHPAVSSLIAAVNLAKKLSENSVLGGF